MAVSVSLTRRDVLATGAAGAALLLTSKMALAQGTPPTPSATVDVAELMKPQPLPDVVIGKDDAPVTIVEYASMTCTHCAAFHAETWPKLKSDYIDTGKVKFILREFPLDALAAAAFMLARCMDDKRTAMVDLLFDQQKNWAFVPKPVDALEAIVKQAGMSSETFKKCLDNRDLYQKVLDERQRGADTFQVGSTPTFFVNGKRATGEMPPDALAKLIDPLLPPAK
jgi:protein-disulfide isomerase